MISVVLRGVAYAELAYLPANVDRRFETRVTIECISGRKTRSATWMLTLREVRNLQRYLNKGALFTLTGGRGAINSFSHTLTVTSDFGGVRVWILPPEALK